MARLATGLLTLALAGCGSGALVQLAGTDDPFPPKKILHGAASVRLMDTAADLLAANVEDLLPVLIGQNEAGWSCLPLDAVLDSGAIEFPVVLGPFVAGVGLRDVGICIDLATLHVALIEGTSPARVRLSVSGARIALSEPAVLSGSVDFGVDTASAACRVHNDLPGPQPHLAVVDFVAIVTLSVDDSGGFALQVELDSLDINAVGLTVTEDCGLPECVDPNPGNIGSPCLECGICTAADFGTDLFELAYVLIGDLLDPVLKQLFNALSAPLLDALLNGRPLDLSAQLNLGNVLGALTSSARIAEDLALLMRPAPSGFAIVDGGLDVLLDGGTSQVAISACVTPTGPEPVFETMAFPALSPHPDGSDLVVAVSRSLLNQALWSLYASGALCLSFDTAEIKQLTNGQLTLDSTALDILVPGVRRWSGERASVRLSVLPELRAQDFPVIRFASTPAGAGVVLRLPSVKVQVETYVDTDYVQLLSLATSAEATLELDVTQGELDLGLVDLALGEVAVTAHGAFEHARLDAIVALGVELLVQVIEGSAVLALSVDPASLGDLLGDLPLDPVLVDARVAGDGASWLALALALKEPAAKPGRLWRPTAPQLQEALGAVTSPTPGVPQRIPEPPAGCSAGSDARGSGTALLLLLLALVLRRVGWRKGVVALALFGCSSPEAPEAACARRSDCPPGYTCNNATAQCVPEQACLRTADCCPGLSCFEGTCRTFVTCSAKSSCPTEQHECVDGACIAPRCGTDEQCGSDARCLSGRCSEALPCGGCGEGTACEPATGTCVAMSSACAGVSCPAGQSKVVDGSTPGDVSCSPLEMTCICVPMPPVRAPVPTAWLNLVALPEGLRVIGRDAHYGDLALATLGSGGAAGQSASVAGVPDAAPSGDPMGPRAGIAEPGDDWGRHTAAATLGDGIVALTRDDTTDEHRLLLLDGGGAISTSYPLAGAGGFGASIAVGADGALHAAWFTAAAGVRRLVYGRAPFPANPESWVYRTVSETSVADDSVTCDPGCGLLRACVQGLAGPECAVPDLLDTCEPPCDQADLCVGGTCRARVPSGTMEPWSQVPGSSTTLALWRGEPILAWYDEPRGTLWLSRTLSAGVSTTSRLAGGGGADAGRGVRIVSTPDDHLAVIHRDAVRDQLEVLYGAGPEDLTRTLVIKGARAGTMAFSASGQLLVAYGTADGTAVRLMARGTEWVEYTAVSGAGLGRATAIAVDDGEVTVVTTQDRLSPLLVPLPSLRWSRFEVAP